ncbi:5-methyltetrahydropteroyltriglutamate--homocysteine S-methyltransferase [uncultured Desulfovibrio sp.]|uniref:5-methyltetrahydropteroyltriglutamate-- homocysteine S-methyltransferase n=1 Tax=uncultured Desulfovibrio sp. TaxID=167968 RepID=UPI0003A8D190|nr:5-methyltetrahydropteroyltriglutamate--homocysteine S-methyltransferase [uncultured Desulfovibrio sp.]
MRTHILGFPSIGKQRELKEALESFWQGGLSAESLYETCAALKKRHWRIQKEAGLDFVSTGDFSLYDRMLDITCMLGAVPPRFAPCRGDTRLDRYFNLARGDVKRNIAALEMTKWFDTNYHYLVPEIVADTRWKGEEHPVVADTRLALKLGFSPKPALIGPFTWLALAKAQGGAGAWTRLDAVAAAYAELLSALAPLCVRIQIEEPALCTELLPPEAAGRFHETYAALNVCGDGKLMLTTYFGPLARNLDLAIAAGCAALHVDLVRGREQLEAVLAKLPEGMELSLGLVNGRNIWKTDYSRALPLLEQAVAALGAGRILLGSSCSLLHCPVDADEETALPEHIRSRLAFAAQKCAELAELRSIAENGDHAALLPDAADHADIRIDAVRQRVAAVSPAQLSRHAARPERRAAQAWLDLPLLPTTTIGSFPQTDAIRKIRLDYKRGDLSEADYLTAIRGEIKECIEKQEKLGLDVFVHGEAERNDMVEYFGQQLGGFCFTRNGWVQSYGSRCVKPPVIYGDVYRKHPMTVDWILYAQSLTAKPVKGMLTGPVTILCWSFVREDLERSEVCKQIALAIRDEVLDLEKAGIRIIQIDEAALREGMPLTEAEAAVYLRWAVDAFRLASSGVDDATQIHTHMCYSEFNTILPWIAQMDADVISIESSRSGMELLDAFTAFRYQGEVGPGVYDIHSPRIPGEEEITGLLRRALQHIPKEQLWVNPDCGLKTRRWEEAYPSLEHMVAAALRVRESLS